MGMSAQSVVKTAVVAILTALAALIIGVMQSLTTAATASLGLTAFQALIVPGTGTPHAADDYVNNVLNYYVVPGADPACSVTAPAGPCPTTQHRLLRDLLANTAAGMGRPIRSEVERVGRKRGDWPHHGI
ncbi:MAG: hypothetical protein QOC76_1046 [Mycobacterium sp.]|nr:hypothetical protein [Mycobacterium sp.]